MPIKQLIMLALSVVLCFALAGCEPTATSKPENAEPAAQSAVSEPAANANEPIAETTEYPPVFEEDVEYVEAAHRLTDYFSKGEFESAMDMFDATMRKVSDADYWRRAWNKERQQFGDFVKTGECVAGRMDEGGKTYVIVHHTLVFSKSSRIQRTVLDLDGLVAGLFIIPGEVKLDYGSGQAKPGAKEVDQDASLPEGLSETEVSIESQPGFPLKGSLTRPKGPIKAVLLLIPGSGPNDRDESVGANKPFRDLAYGLALKGLASLRLDKISQTHPGKLAAHPDLKRFTIDEEYALDAVSAFNWLTGQEDLKGLDIYLLGHSQGGFLAAYINSKGANVTGYIILGSITRPIWQVQYDQNKQLLEEFREADRLDEAEEGYRLIEAMAAKAEQLEGMSEEELLKENIFGVSGWYARHLIAINPPALHLADRKPVLVLHGGQDRQISLKDFQSWQEGLKDHPDATFRLYDNLNHLFGDYQGEPVPYSQMVEVEYAQRTPVPQYVIDDISAWIESHLAASD